MPDSLAWQPLLAFAAGIAFGLLTTIGVYRAVRRKRLIEDLPTSKTTGVFIGLVELKGTAETDRPLTSYLAGAACVYYAWTVDEHWSRTVIETYTDSQGRTQTRTRHESGWKTVASDTKMAPFYLRDDCGVILVRPQGASIEPREVFSMQCGRSDPLYYAKGPPHAISDSDHRRRFCESAVPLDAELYVIGRARERTDVVAAEIAADPQAPLFLISTRPEHKISAGYGWTACGWYVLGALLWAAGMAAHEGLLNHTPRERWPVYAAAAAVYLAVGLGAWVLVMFNSLIELRERVRRAWSQVDVQLKRRHDLITNILAIVRGLRDHERQVQEVVADLRGQLAATPPGQPGEELHGCRGVLRIIVERYPELAAQEAFTSLQQSLVETEQRIALARGYFNDIASFYNTRLERIPDRFVASLARLAPQPLLAAEGFQRAPVSVLMEVAGSA